MSGTAWLYALLFAGITAAAGFIFELFNSNDKKPLTTAILSFILSFFVNWLILYTLQPYFTHVLSGWMGMIILSLGLAAMMSAFVAMGTEGEYNGASGGALIFMALLLIWGIWYGMTPPAALRPDNADYKKMANVLQPIIMPDGAVYQDADLTSIIQVPESVAWDKCAAVLSNSAGQNGIVYGNYLTPNRAYLQFVQGKPMYVCDLAVTKNVTFQNEGGALPGFILVDAVDSHQPAVPVWGKAIKYAPGVWFYYDLDRRVYMDYVLGHDFRVKDLDGMEVDDELNPYYTGSETKHYIGVTGMLVTGFLQFDPQTGKDVTYSVKDVPAWVDRVYPLDWATEYVKFWAMYHAHNRFPYEGVKGMEALDNCHNVTIPGGFQYQCTLTSVGDDPSVTHFVTFNPKTAETKVYAMRGKTFETIKAQMVKKAGEINAKIDYKADECSLMYVLDRETVYCMLITVDEKGNNGIAGYGFVEMSQTLNNSTNNYAVAETFPEAYDAYVKLVNSGNGGANVSNTENDIQVSGTVVANERVDKPTFDNASRLITVQTDDGKTVYLVASASSFNAALARPGLKVTATAYQIPGQPALSVRKIVVEGSPDFGDYLTAGANVFSWWILAALALFVGGVAFVMIVLLRRYAKVHQY